MNFGDILNKWEKQSPNEVYDKGAESGNRWQNAAEKRRRLRNKKHDAQIDLHGLTHDEAWGKLEQFFNESRANGYEKLLVIHGKGNHSTGDAVLKRTTRKFIEHCPFAGESGRGKTSNGGEGATWVLLKGAPEQET